jgi:release factor glutamine methyltransferase
MPRLSEKLDEADAILRDGGVVDPRREAASLLALAIKRDKAFLIAHPEYLLDPAEASVIDGFVRRRASHEPFQYISGVQEFYGLEFDVTPDVLIPRPETEMVVERALELIGDHGFTSFCEVGIGSGCIAVSILHHAKSGRAVGLDISRAALRVAQRNAERHHVGQRLTLLGSDVFGALSDEKFQLIVSNPPYVPVSDIEGLQAEVRDHEPRIALTDDADGLSIIRRIVDGAPGFLQSNGSLLIEIGFDQSEKVAAMFDPLVWQTTELMPDLQGIPRLVCSRIK